MTKTINTRIQLKYDTLTNWQTNNPTLLAGEIAIATVGNSHTTTTPDNGTHPVVFKVGPGAYNSLPFTSALAADVYAWAKEASITVNKDGAGNVVAGIEWDATANDGKGGLKYTTASVATSEGLQAVQEAIEAINKELDTFGDIVTHDANEFATAAQGTKADNAAPQATTYTKTEVNNLVAPLATTEALNGVKATAEAAAPQATTYNKTEVDSLVQGAKDYADNNDANTEYHIEYDSTAKEIKLIAGADANKMTIDATSFIKDGMIDTVEFNADDNDLVITFNTEAGKDAITVPLDKLIDVYTIEGTDTATIDITASTNGNKHTVSATVIDGSLTNAHIAADAAISVSKLDPTIVTDVVNDDYNLTIERDSEYEDGMSDTHKYHVNLLFNNEKGNVKFTNGSLMDPGLSANVDLTNYATKDELPTASGEATIATIANDIVTLKAGATLGSNHALGNSTDADITLHKIAKTGSINDAAEAYDNTNADGSPTGTDYIIFNCGTASKLI